MDYSHHVARPQPKLSGAWHGSSGGGLCGWHAAKEQRPQARRRKQSRNIFMAPAQLVQKMRRWNKEKEREREEEKKKENQMLSHSGPHSDVKAQLLIVHGARVNHTN